METLKTKRFVVRKSLVGKNQIIEVTFKSGKQVIYNHDKVYDIMKDKLETMNCFIKYKSYTSSTSIPVILRDKEIVQSLSNKSLTLKYINMSNYFTTIEKISWNLYDKSYTKLSSEEKSNVTDVYYDFY